MSTIQLRLKVYLIGKGQEVFNEQPITLTRQKTLYSYL